MASEEGTIGDDDAVEEKAVGCSIDEPESGMKPERLEFVEPLENSVDINSIEDGSREQQPSTSIDDEPGFIRCELCGVTFTSVVYRDEHRKLCRGQRRLPQLVEPLSVPTDIQDLATVVDGKKLYSCTFCMYTTPRGGHMTRHLLSHMGARPFTCVFCGKTFTQGAGLAHHIRIHSGDKPYRCDECDFACGRAIALKRHKNTHTREVMFACTHCDYATSQTYNLKVHLRTHSGERPYKCALCDYCAGSTCAMRKHERNKHTPKLLCADCPRKFPTQEKLDKHIIKKHTKTDVKKKRKRVQVSKAVAKPRQATPRKKKNISYYDKADTETDESNDTTDKNDLVLPDNSGRIASNTNRNGRVTRSATDSVESNLKEDFSSDNSDIVTPEVCLVVTSDNSDILTLKQETPEVMDVSTNS